MMFVPLAILISSFATSTGFTMDDFHQCVTRYNQNIRIFGVLPVYGWDNLRNKEAGQVFDTQYTRCKATEDGKYLIPDNVNLIPRKSSKIEQTQDVISAMGEYTSVTALSVNTHTGLNFMGVGISGTFSDTYLRAMRQQLKVDSVVVRKALRYTRYSASRQPHSPLHPTFIAAVLNIARSLRLNQESQARYHSEVLVRDFGTHALTDVLAGAALVKETFVSRKFVDYSKFSLDTVDSSLSVNFFDIRFAGAFGTEVSYGRKNNQSVALERAILNSFLDTYGGSQYAPNMTLTDWASDLDDNLVALDRSGEPIYHLINYNTLPELPLNLMVQVKQKVREAVQKYYEYNTYRGCTDHRSRNFDPQANFQDGNCQPISTNLTFGGVFQMCLHDAILCWNKESRNRRTGEFTCPKRFQPMLLFTETLRRSCQPCGAQGSGKKCCKPTKGSDYASIYTYWCYSHNNLPKDTGYLFGGFYSSAIDNIVTGDKSCPEYHYAASLGDVLKICISDNYVLGMKGSLPFGGFYSCKQGNPLAARNVTRGVQGGGEDSPQAEWPKRCPDGFSAHNAHIKGECSVYFCIMTKALSTLRHSKTRSLRLPPFSILSELEYESMEDEDDVALITEPEVGGKAGADSRVRKRYFLPLTVASAIILLMP